MMKTQHIPSRLPEPFAPEPPLPKNYEERQDAYTNAVFAAVAYLQTRLRSSDSEKATEAALAILELEKTRLRHGRNISGTGIPCDAPLKPIGYFPPPDDANDEDEDHEKNDEDEEDEESPQVLTDAEWEEVEAAYAKLRKDREKWQKRQANERDGNRDRKQSHPQYRRSG